MLSLQIELMKNEHAKIYSWLNLRSFLASVFAGMGLTVPPVGGWLFSSCVRSDADP